MIILTLNTSLKFIKKNGFIQRIVTGVIDSLCKTKTNHIIFWYIFNVKNEFFWVFWFAFYFSSVQNYKNNYLEGWMFYAFMMLYFCNVSVWIMRRGCEISNNQNFMKWISFSLNFIFRCKNLAINLQYVFYVRTFMWKGYALVCTFWP